MNHRIILMVLIFMSGYVVAGVSAGWLITTLDPATPNKHIGSTSLKLDSSGYPHISYYAGDPNNDLKFVSWQGTSWVIENVDKAGDVGTDHSLMLDWLDNPNIAYYDSTNGGLKVAYLSGSNWVNITVAGGTPSFFGYGIDPCIAPDGSISFTDIDTGKLWYRDWTGSSWQTVEVDSCLASDSTLALDSAGEPTIVYTDVEHNQLKLVKRISGVWNSPNVIVDNPGGGYPSLALESSNLEHLCYWDMAGGGLKYRRFYMGPGYVTVTVDTGGGYMNSLALDREGHPHIAYRDALEQLKYAEWTGSSWRIIQVDPAQTDAGVGISLALDIHGNPHIAWTEINGALKYAKYVPPVGIGLFRPSTARWYLDYDSNGLSNYQVTWGASTDIPVTGDWDGDRRDEIGLWRPSTGRWYLDYDNNGLSNYQVTWGASTDKPVAGDWDNDGYDEIGLWRPSTARWYLDYDNNGLSDYRVYWGASTDKPVTGDWDNDGYDEIGLWRPSTSKWYLDYDNNGLSNYQITWGASTDRPVTGDWDEDGRDEIGLFRPSTARWYLDYDNNGLSNYQVTWGAGTDKPITGSWF